MSFKNIIEKIKVKLYPYRKIDKVLIKNINGLYTVSVESSIFGFFSEIKMLLKSVNINRCFGLYNRKEKDVLENYDYFFELVEALNMYFKSPVSNDITRHIINLFNKLINEDIFFLVNLNKQGFYIDTYYNNYTITKLNSDNNFVLIIPK